MITKATHALSHTHSITHSYTLTHTHSICAWNKLEQVSNRVESSELKKGCNRSRNHFNGTFCICISSKGVGKRQSERQGGTRQTLRLTSFIEINGMSETIKCINTQRTQTTHIIPEGGRRARTWEGVRQDGVAIVRSARTWHEANNHFNSRCLP